MICRICGKRTPKEFPICQDCLIDGNIPDEAKEDADQLRDVAGVLSITANTDGNIQRAMESILRIAARLERRKKENARLQTKDCESQTTYNREDL